MYAYLVLHDTNTARARAVHGNSVELVLLTDSFFVFCFLYFVSW